MHCRKVFLFIDFTPIGAFFKILFRIKSNQIPLLLSMTSETERMQGGYTEIIRVQLAEIFILTMREIARKSKRLRGIADLST